MESLEVDGRSSTSSWSTCDIRSQAEYLLSHSTQYSNADWKTVKKVLPNSILAWIKSQSSDSQCKQGLFSSIEDIFAEDLDCLIENFRYKCCLRKRHSSSCFRKWKNIKRRVLNLAFEFSEDEKPIFKITKREKSGKNLLLDESQPFWVHRIMVGNFFCFNTY